MLVDDGFRINKITGYEKIIEDCNLSTLSMYTPPKTPNMSRRIGRTNLIGAHRTYSWKTAEMTMVGKKASLL